MELTPIYLSLKLALFSALLLLVVSLPVAIMLNKARGLFAGLFKSLITLPILLPPTVIGFYFLIVFSPQGLVGGPVTALGIELVFSFTGLVLACAIYSLPFMMQPLLQGLQSIPDHYHKIAASFGKTKWQIFVYITLPLLKPAILNGFIMTFAHTMGAFGVVLMVGGSIPGETRTASVAVYEEVQALNFAGAHYYSLLFIAFGVAVITGLRWLGERRQYV